MRIGGHPGQRDNPRLGDHPEHLGCCLPVDRAVFDINGQPFAAGPGKESCSEGAAEVEPAADLDLSAGQCFFEGVVHFMDSWIRGMVVGDFPGCWAVCHSSAGISIRLREVPA